MSESELILVIIVPVWLAIGIVLAVFMGRRGHDSFSWFVLGAILGPVACVLAIDARRHPESQGETILRRGRHWPGVIDVLIGADGSPESRAAARGTVKLFGERLGRLTLAAAIPFDATKEAEELTSRMLGTQVRDLDDDRVRVEIVRGPPAEALRDLAQSSNYQVLAVGTRGSGHAKAVLGSVASQLSHGSPVPVLMFGNANRDRAPQRLRPWEEG